ncbi:hypothetical protein [Metabacillus herbersteinensis]|uniref:hypothetical protein n=1 Tax=Metabacillus herbersteinensis TaxID=283816 RepID=UPI00366B4FC6
MVLFLVAVRPKELLTLKNVIALDLYKDNLCNLNPVPSRGRSSAVNATGSRPLLVVIATVSTLPESLHKLAHFSMLIRMSKKIIFCRNVDIMKFSKIKPALSEMERLFSKIEDHFWNKNTFL